MRDYNFYTNIKGTNVRNNIRSKVTAYLLRWLWYLAPGLTRWMTRRVFFSPRRYRAAAEEKAVMMQGRPFQFRVHDKTIHGRRWGAGPEVLLVHGWNGGAAQFYRFIERLVADGYTAVAIDGPAHGASSGKMTSYFEFTDMVRKILTDEKSFNVSGIIAHSFGAAAVINALTKEKIAVKTVLIAPVLKLQELLQQAFGQYGVPQRIYRSLIQEFESRYGYRLAEDNPHLLIKDLPGPVLIVHDVNDRTTPHHESARQANQLRHIALWSPEGLGHNRVLKDREVMARCMAHLKLPSPNIREGA